MFLFKKKWYLYNEVYGRILRFLSSANKDPSGTLPHDVTQLGGTLVDQNCDSSADPPPNNFFFKFLLQDNLIPSNKSVILKKEVPISNQFGASDLPIFSWFMGQNLNKYKINIIRQR
jgi:hypothetical protein